MDLDVQYFTFTCTPCHIILVLNFYNEGTLFINKFQQHICNLCILVTHILYNLSIYITLYPVHRYISHLTSLRYPSLSPLLRSPSPVCLCYQWLLSSDCELLVPCSHTRAMCGMPGWGQHTQTNTRTTPPLKTSSSQMDIISTETWPLIKLS